MPALLLSKNATAAQLKLEKQPGVQAWRRQALKLLTRQWQGLPALGRALGEQGNPVWRDLRDCGVVEEREEKITMNGVSVGFKLYYRLRRSK